MGKNGLYIIISTGTVDKLINMGVLTQTAANLGMPVGIFVTATATAAFKKDGYKNSVVAPSGFEKMIKDIADGLTKLKSGDWHEMVKTAKEIGEVRVYVCSLMAGAMNLKKEDLDPIVDEIIGAAAFMQEAADGQVIFI
ncbi:MAG: peroxiredoxin [Thermoplasmata archaeon]